MLAMTGWNSAQTAKSAASPTYRMPDEGEAHAATWMAFGATAAAWGTTGAYGLSRRIARQDLIRIAVNLSRFETVKMLVAPGDLREAQQLLALARKEQGPFTGGESLPDIESGGPVDLISCAVDDLWVRDTGPVFVRDGKGKLHGINFNFNGWGQENTGAVGWRRDPSKARNGIATQPIKRDRQVADFILGCAGVPKVDTWLVMEGGGIEVDGEGTAICTESCILNPNRNPGRSKPQVEVELRRVLGVQKVIWLPGVKAQDITDGHVDFYARFVGPGRVVCGLELDPNSPEYTITHQHQTMLKRATDAKGRKLQVVPLVAPDADNVYKAVLKRNQWTASTFNEDSFAAGYIGFYLANDCVLMAAFGDPQADHAAFEVLSGLYPDRVVMQLPTDGLANGGGTIHCATQQQPRG